MSSLPVLVLNSGSSSIKFQCMRPATAAHEDVFEGAVDGIGTDHGKFWIKDAAGKKLVDQTPALPKRSAGFFNWLPTRSTPASFPRRRPSAIASFAAGRRCTRTSASLQR